MVASTTSQMVSPQMRTSETKVPIISDLWYPKERDLVAGLTAIFKDKMDIPKPTMSDARWAESVKIAMELATYPPISCAMMKTVDNIVAKQRVLRASWLLLANFAFLAWKSIGVLGGMGVP